MESHQISGGNLASGVGGNSKPVQVVQPLIISPMSMVTNSTAVQMQGQTTQFIANPGNSAHVSPGNHQQHSLPPLSSITSSMPAVGQKPASSSQTHQNHSQPPYLTQNVNIMNISFAPSGAANGSNSSSGGAATSLASRAFPPHSSIPGGLLSQPGAVYMQPQTVYQQAISTTGNAPTMVALAPEGGVTAPSTLLSASSNSTPSSGQTITLYQLSDGTYFMGSAPEALNANSATQSNHVSSQAVQMVQMATATPTYQTPVSHSLGQQQMSQDTGSGGTFVLAGNNSTQTPHFLTENAAGGKVFIQHQGTSQMSQQVLMAMPTGTMSSMSGMGPQVIYTTQQPPQAPALQQRIFLAPNTSLQGQPLQTHVIQTVPAVPLVQKQQLAPLAPRPSSKKPRISTTPTPASQKKSRSNGNNRLTSPKGSTGSVSRLATPVTAAPIHQMQTQLTQVISQPVTVIRPLNSADNRNPSAAPVRAMAFPSPQAVSIPIQAASSQTVVYQNPGGTQMVAFSASPQQVPVSSQGHTGYLTCNPTTAVSFSPQQIVSLQSSFTSNTALHLLRQAGLLEQPRAPMEEILQVNVQLQSRCFSILLSRPQKVSLERLLTSLNVPDQMCLLQTFVQEQSRLYGAAAPSQQQSQAMQQLAPAPPQGMTVPMSQTLVFASSSQVSQVLSSTPRPLTPGMKTTLLPSNSIGSDPGRGIPGAAAPLTSMAPSHPVLASTVTAVTNTNHLTNQRSARPSRMNTSQGNAGRAMSSSMPILSPLQRLVQADQVRCLMAGVEQLNMTPPAARPKGNNCGISDELHTVTGSGKIEEKLLAFHVVFDADTDEGLTRVDDALKSYTNFVQSRAEQTISYLNHLFIREKEKSSMWSSSCEVQLSMSAGAVESETADLELLKTELSTRQQEQQQQLLQMDTQTVGHSDSTTMEVSSVSYSSSGMNWVSSVGTSSIPVISSYHASTSHQASLIPMKHFHLPVSIQQQSEAPASGHLS